MKTLVLIGSSRNFGVFLIILPGQLPKRRPQLLQAV